MGQVLLRCNSQDDLYHLWPSSHVSGNQLFFCERTTQDVWHTRPGLPSYSVVNVLNKKYHLHVINKFN